MKRRKPESITPMIYKIDIRDFEHSAGVHTDAGGWGFTWICPDCHERLTWAPHAWWRVECCRVWDVDISITGFDKKSYWNEEPVIDFQI